MGSQRTYVTDTTAENLSTRLITVKHFSLYAFDKKQVRIGEAGIEISNVGPGQTVKFQTMIQTSGTPANLTLTAVAEVAKTISLTVNSSPQGARLAVDGQDVGITPKLIRIGVGKHNLTFSKEGFNTGHFPVEVGPDDLSNGSVNFELGTLRYDTIELRDGTVLVGDLDSVAEMDIVVRVGGSLQHIDRNRIKRILLVERDTVEPSRLPAAEGKQ
jgi:hypothetical protein